LKEIESSEIEGEKTRESADSREKKRGKTARGREREERINERT
jgi:hypothetical protein